MTILNEEGLEMSDAGRARRMAGRIKQIVATGIDTQVKDPRLGMVTITEVRVTGDLHDATVFYTVLGDRDARDESALALESAKGVLRSEVGRQTGVRFTPTLTFVLDSVPETAKQIEDLLAAAAAADAEVEAARQGARPAGDPDPYRKPRENDEEDEDASAP
jgi:ribosome-binding factor A